MKLIDMSCPKCGAVMEADLEKGKVVCAHCGNLMLIEKEDNAGEIQKKAQAKAYGYYKGRLKAETEAHKSIQRKKGTKKFLRTVFIIGCIVLFILFVNGVGRLTKPKVNPFDCITVSFQGNDGKGKMVITVNDVEGVDVHRIMYDSSKEWNLYQGETISIRAASEDYRLTETEKFYTVEGLDEYLKDLDNIPEEILKLIHARAESVLDLNLHTTKELDYLVSMAPVKLFLLTDGKQSNLLYDIFEVRFDSNAGECTYYVVVNFNNVIIRNTEQPSLDMSGGMYIGSLTQVRGSTYIMAYDSVEEVRNGILSGKYSYMELKELDLPSE